MSEKLWCAICGEETDHKSGRCPKLKGIPECQGCAHAGDCERDFRDYGAGTKCFVPAPNASLHSPEWSAAERRSK